MICLFSCQYAEMEQSAGRYGEDLKSTRAEIADMNRRMARLQSEIDMVKAQVRDRDFLLFIWMIWGFDIKVIIQTALPGLWRPLNSMPRSAWLLPLLAKQFGSSDHRGWGTRRTGGKRCQTPHQRVGRSSSESQTGYGTPSPPIPGTYEC